MHNCKGCGRTGLFQMKNGAIYCAPSPNACPGIQKKTIKTCTERFGVPHPNQNPDVQAQRKKHNIERYGVDHPYKTKELQDRVAATNLERYGVKNPFASKTVQKKIRATLKANYGVENPSQNSDIQAKKVATFMKHYGFPHHFQNPMMFRILQKGRLSKKTVELQGKTFVFQGAEGKVLKELLKSGVAVCSIETDPTKMPAIWYTRSNGKKARYYPDIFIPEQNWLIEVKSMWTFMVQKEDNLRKREACLKAGFKFNFVIR